MARKSWTDRQLKILREEYPVCKNTRELAKRIGKPYSAIKSRATILKLHRRVSNSNFGRTGFSKKQQLFIKKNYAKIPTNQIAIALGRSETMVRTFMKRNGLIIPDSVLRRFIEDSRIKQGNIPINKGKKQSEYMTPEAIAKTVATRFKKGEIAPNKAHFRDGDITIREDIDNQGRIRKYKWIRIKIRIWKMLHVYNWEKEKGPVPEGHIIVFKTTDTLDCSVSNLRMITQKEHAAETRNKDGYIAMTMAHTRGAGRGKYNKLLQKKLLNHPDLIDLQRKKLELKRTINEKRRENNSDKRCA